MLIALLLHSRSSARTADTPEPPSLLYSFSLSLVSFYSRFLEHIPSPLVHGLPGSIQQLDCQWGAECIYSYGGKSPLTTMLFCSALLPQNLSILDHYGWWVSLLQSISLHNSLHACILTFRGRGMRQRSLLCVSSAWK
jgi:hypothetical protein